MNKATALLNGTSCSLTASQAMTLFEILPFVVGQYIPVDCAWWHVYLLLAKICDIVLAPCINRNWVNELDAFVHEFYAQYIPISGKTPFPKMHYLLQYPKLLVKFGPLRRLWSVRFEAYHQPLKKVVRQCHNFENVPYTVATRIQLRKCLEQQSDFCLSNILETKGATKLSIDTFSKPVKNLLMDCSIAKDTKVTSVTELYQNGSHFKRGDIHVLYVLENEYVFFKIELILKNRQKWLLCGRLLTTETFVTHYHSYYV